MLWQQLHVRSHILVPAGYADISVTTIAVVALKLQVPQASAGVSECRSAFWVLHRMVRLMHAEKPNIALDTLKMMTLETKVVIYPWQIGGPAYLAD